MTNKGRIMVTLGAVGLTALNLGVLSAGQAEPTQAAPDVQSLVEERFAETAVEEVNCDGFGPLCEVVAGKTVFYVDPEAQHAFIGRVFDLEAKSDLTQRTLARIAPAAPSNPSAPAAPARQAVSWDALPFDAAITRNRGAEHKVAVFSDLNCGYCQRLALALEGADDIEVNEFLVGRIRSEEASNAIACASDPQAALQAYYADRSVPDAACGRDIVGPARAAARAAGIGGTPTFVRRDGAILTGFQGLDHLRSWIAADTTNPQLAENAR